MELGWQDLVAIGIVLVAASTWSTGLGCIDTQEGERLRLGVRKMFQPIGREAFGPQQMVEIPAPPLI